MCVSESEPTQMLVSTTIFDTICSITNVCRGTSLAPSLKIIMSIHGIHMSYDGLVFLNDVTDCVIGSRQSAWMTYHRVPSH